MNPSFALLTALGAPLPVPLLDSLSRANFKPAAIIIDGKVPDSGLAIFRARIDPTYIVRDLTDVHVGDIPCYFVKDHNAEPSVRLARNLGVDYFLNAGTPRILKADFLNISKGVINAHPGLLPKYRGCTCVEWSIYNNDPVGASAHFMTTDIDAGPLIYGESMQVKPGESYETIRTRMIGHQVHVLVKALGILSNPPASGFPDSEDGNYFRPIPEAALLEVKSRLLRGEYASP